jgi:hypothetical protein
VKRITLLVVAAVIAVFAASTSSRVTEAHALAGCPNPWSASQGWDGGQLYTAAWYVAGCPAQYGSVMDVYVYRWNPSDNANPFLVEAWSGQVIPMNGNHYLNWYCWQLGGHNIYRFRFRIEYPPEPFTWQYSSWQTLC